MKKSTLAARAALVAGVAALCLPLWAQAQNIATVPGLLGWPMESAGPNQPIDLRTAFAFSARRQWR